MPISTRSQKKLLVQKQEKQWAQLLLQKQQKHSSNIDFDAASEAWRANKVKIGQGHYAYLCSATTQTTGKSCKNTCKENSEFCGIHSKKVQVSQEDQEKKARFQLILNAQRDEVEKIEAENDRRYEVEQRYAAHIAEAERRNAEHQQEKARIIEEHRSEIASASNRIAKYLESVRPFASNDNIKISFAK